MNYPGAGRLLGLARAGIIRFDTSEAILNETFSVLRDKFGWEGYRLHFVWQEIMNLCNVVKPVGTLEVAKHDPEDDRVLECAEVAGSEFIVNGDQDLLRLRAYGTIRIVNVAELLLSKGNAVSRLVPRYTLEFPLLGRRARCRQLTHAYVDLRHGAALKCT